MNKFKVGDVVKVISGPMYVGETRTISEINISEYDVQRGAYLYQAIYKDNPISEDGFHEYELELDQSYYNEQRMKKELGIK